MKARDRFTRPFDLTDRECDVLEQMAEGGTVADIAARLFIARATCKQHRDSIYRKMGVHSSAAAVAKGFRAELLS